MNDAHVHGLTWSLDYYVFNKYCPEIILRYSQDNYIIVKSGYEELSEGDIIISVDGKTPSQIEDSLRPYISAGNSSVFRRYMCIYMFRGDFGSLIQIEYQDSLGNNQEFTTERNYIYNNSWLFSYYPNDTLATAKFRKWDCNVGYVNMGVLMSADVDEMYYNLINTSAIIFDIRNYPNGTAVGYC